MRQKTRVERHVFRLRARGMIVVICVICAAILLTQCNKDDVSGTDENTAGIVESSTSKNTKAVSDLTMLIETQPDGEINETPLPIETPQPTTDLIEGIKAVEAIAQDMITPYMSNANDCREAIQNGKMERCVGIRSKRSRANQPHKP